MGRAFEHPQQARVEATPEEVWAAISTGPGIDSWFMGRNEVAGGVVRTAFGGFDLPASTVTAAEPGRRFAHTSETAADGRFVAYEFLIEGRDRAGTTVRMVTSGFLPGDDWEGEYEAMADGLAMFFATLVEYLTHFAGRTATPLTEFGPPVRDWPRAWETLYAALEHPEDSVRLAPGSEDRVGLTLASVAPASEGQVRLAPGPGAGLRLTPGGLAPEPGDKVRLAPDGLDPVEGVVYFVNAQTLGVRSGDGLYRFLQGMGGSMVAAHHLFAVPPDQGPAWRAWLERLRS